MIECPTADQSPERRRRRVGRDGGTVAAAGARRARAREPRPTAAIAMKDLYCSCKLTSGEADNSRAERAEGRQRQAGRRSPAGRQEEKQARKPPWAFLIRLRSCKMSSQPRRPAAPDSSPGQRDDMQVDQRGLHLHLFGSMLPSGSAETTCCTS